MKIRSGGIRRGYRGAEFFGDYDFDTQEVRIFLYTPKKKKLTAPKTLLHTLVHEFMHHYDRHALKLSRTFHTSGFFMRVNALYKPLAKFIEKEDKEKRVKNKDKVPKS